MKLLFTVKVLNSYYTSDIRIIILKLKRTFKMRNPLKDTADRWHTVKVEVKYYLKSKLVNKLYLYFGASPMCKFGEWVGMV